MTVSDDELVDGFCISCSAVQYVGHDNHEPECPEKTNWWTVGLNDDLLNGDFIQCELCRNYLTEGCSYRLLPRLPEDGDDLEEALASHFDWPLVACESCCRFKVITNKETAQ